MRARSCFPLELERRQLSGNVGNVSNDRSEGAKLSLQDSLSNGSLTRLFPTFKQLWNGSESNRNNNSFAVAQILARAKRKHRDRFFWLLTHCSAAGREDTPQPFRHPRKRSLVMLRKRTVEGFTASPMSPGDNVGASLLQVIAPRMGRFMPFNLQHFCNRIAGAALLA